MSDDDKTKKAADLLAFHDEIFDLLKKYIPEDLMASDKAGVEPFVRTLIHVAGHLAMGGKTPLGDFVKISVEEATEAGKCLLMMAMEERMRRTLEQTLPPIPRDGEELVTRGAASAPPPSLSPTGAVLVRRHCAFLCLAQFQVRGNRRLPGLALECIASWPLAQRSEFGAGDASSGDGSASFHDTNKIPQERKDKKF